MSRAPQKRFLDIEMALRWAYRDELPKRGRTTLPPLAQEGVWSPYIAPGGYGDTSPMFRDGSGGGPSGGFADGWSRDPGYPVALGRPHDDALAIEDAVWRLKTWRGYGFGQGPDNPDAAGLTWGFAGLECGHEQAAMEAIASMGGSIACHARAGSRPGPWRATAPGVPLRWVQEIPRPQAINGGNGKPRVVIDEVIAEVWDKRRDRYRQTPVIDLPGRRAPPGAPVWNEPRPSPPLRSGVYRTGSYCPLQWRPDPAKVVASRAEYAAWRMGLDLLWRHLEGNLESVGVLPPSAPWRPWAGEIETHGRPPELFRGRRDEPFRAETREQAAMRRRAGQRRALGLRSEEGRPMRQPQSGKRNGAA